jgi:hypothetical protein
MKNIIKNIYNTIHFLATDKSGEIKIPIEIKYENGNEPYKIRRMRSGKTIFIVGTYFSNESKNTLKDILERSIKREVSSKLKN